MKLVRSLSIAAFAIAIPAALCAQANPSQLNAVLQQMNTASKNFRSASADLHCDYYERVVRDTTTQAGPVYFLRTGDATQMGLVVEGPQNKPEKVIQYKDGVLQMFDPGVDQITVLRAGANQAQYQEYFTLGFGGSGVDLARSWKIKDLGPQTLSDGTQQVKTDELDLMSKDPDSKTFSHITIWVDPTRAISLRQVFYLSNDDKRTCNYTNIKYNSKIDMKRFEIRKNSHTTIVNR